MNALLVSLLLLFPLAVSAQEGTVRYDHAVRYDFDVPERIPAEWRDQIPSSNVGSLMLLFNESASLMIPAPKPEEEEELTDMELRSQGLTARLKMGSSSRTDHETLLGSYVSDDDGTAMEAVEFMSRTFLIQSTQPAYAWRLSQEQSEFLGYAVQKATAVKDSAVIEAWFTPEIPVSTGPGLFGGLPGLILVVSVDDGYETFSATEVSLGDLEEGAVAEPEDGQKVTREEYEEIVAEKLEELALQRRRRGDRR
jgi:GLPGLI family protein